MDIQLSDVIGHVAAFLTTVSFVPQVVRVVQTKSTKDISLGMFLLMASGVTLWLIYGLMIMQWPLIMCNGATILLVMVILYYKLRYK
ncbi:MAG: SemiSWEET transporter [Sphingobacteriales bacterium JAD_PAG50586_3]|nr:MAG: SemiSWEET transporter [Sphingobacteriales bacterium JAD_PAG50586_3]